MTIWHLRTFIFLPEVLVRYEIRCNADFQEKSALYRIFDPHCCEFCPENKTALQRIRTDRDRTVGILTVIQFPNILFQSYKCGQDDRILKWKPLSHNSVDFKLIIMKEERLG